MAHTELALRERRAIKHMLRANMPVSKIAAHLPICICHKAKDAMHLALC